MDEVYDREKLYEEIWREPVTTVAKRYGVSDVALHKACKRLNVPMPPRGYWAKVQAGQTLEKTPLHKADGPKIIIRHIAQKSVVDASTTEVPERFSFLPEEEKAKAIQVCDSVEVQEKLLKPHLLIKQDKELRVDKRRKEREAELSYGWERPRYGYEYWQEFDKKLLCLAIQKDEFHRAYCFLNAIFHAIEDLGGSVRQNESNGQTEIRLMGDPISIKLRSKDGNFSFMIDDYSAPRKNWNDGKTRNLESLVGDIVEGIYECANILKVRREEEEREAERRRIEETQRLERARKQEAEYAHYQKLENSAMDWQRARTIEAYIVDMEKQAQNEQDESRKAEMLEYIAWAKEKVKWVDPLIAQEDPILGKRKYEKPDGEKVKLESTRHTYW